MYHNMDRVSNEELEEVIYQYLNTDDYQRLTKTELRSFLKNKFGAKFNIKNRKNDITRIVFPSVSQIVGSSKQERQAPVFLIQSWRYI